MHHSYINLLALQALRRWNIRPDNGTRSVSAAWSARIRSVQRASSRANRRFTVPDVTRTNLPPGVLNATRWATPFTVSAIASHSRLAFVYYISPKKRM